MKSKRLEPLKTNPATPKFTGSGHNYRCSEGQKRCYLRYMSEGRKSKNKARTAQKQAKMRVKHTLKRELVLHGLARAVRRLESGITRWNDELPMILRLNAAAGS